VLTLASSTYMVAMGLSATAMIRLSHLKGANDYKSIIPIAKSIFVLTIIIELFFAFIFILFHDILPALFLNFHDTAQFLDNKKIIALTSKLLFIAAFFQISDGIQVVVLGALRGLQDVKIPMYICFFAYWIVGFPCCYYLGFYTIYGATGIWIGLWVGLSVAAILLYIRFKIISKKIIQKH
jgi:multidrug resistance protein, MATE family